MTRFGVQFDRAKSFILWERGQLLRIFYQANYYDRDYLFGFSAVASRACAAAHQSKPWSSAEFHEFAPVQHAAKALATVGCRVRNSSFAHRLPFWPNEGRGCQAYGALGIDSYYPSTPLGWTVSVDRPVVLPPPKFRFGWRSSLIARSLRIPRDQFTTALAITQWESTFTLKSSYSRMPYASTWGRSHVGWALPNLDFTFVPLRARDLEINYRMLQTGETRRQVLRQYFPELFAAISRLSVWGYSVAERYVTSGYEIPLSAGSESYVSVLRSLINRVKPRQESDFFRHVFSSSLALGDLLIRTESPLVQALAWA
uniref:Uncharacterized protein n=1 Tax=viral metagenome TaxID=1070528 RepID=A0A2V0RIJ3_9ZZZZ